MAKMLNASWKIFAFFWLSAFLVYLPAGEAGKVGDYYRDWLSIIENASFSDYLNRPGSPTLYQFTQLVTYLLYMIFGASAWAWHLIHLTVHSLCCLALYTFFERLLQDSNIHKATTVALAATLLFSLSAYNSEVIVHEPCFHYLLSFVLMIAILLCVQRFIHQPARGSVLLAGLLYLLSSFSLEMFYATPWLILLLATYYCFIVNRNKALFVDVTRYFFLPALLIFVLHLLLLKHFTGHSVAHFTDVSFLKQAEHLVVKLPKYIFHIVFMGRFWPPEAKEWCYRVLESLSGPIIFYTLVLIAFVALVVRWQRLDLKPKLITLLAVYTLLFAGIVSTREFYPHQWVVYDRYTYFIIPFLYLAIVLAVYDCRGKLIPVISAVFLLANIYFLVKINLRWQRSERVIQGLLATFPDPKGKIALLLNTPENLDGILMIGAQEAGAFKLMYEHDRGKIPSPIYEVVSYNMKEVSDGAHIIVVNDSTVKVTLNQWGTWWWYHYRGAGSYENSAYRVNMVDQGHWYELILKKPAHEYLLLYSVGGQWKMVDMNAGNADQQ